MAAEQLRTPVEIPGRKASIINGVLPPELKNYLSLAANERVFLTLPDGQRVPSLSEKETKILKLIINSPEYSLDLSDPKLKHSYPEIFSKTTNRSFKACVSRLRRKLNTVGWNIETVGLKPGRNNNRRGKLELRRIEKLDNNPENEKDSN